MNEEEEKSREGKDLYRRPQKIQTPALYLSICLLTSKIQIYDKSLPHSKHPSTTKVKAWKPDFLFW
jgi:hypothetical protein